MKISFNKKNWPLLAFVSLFVIGRFLWADFDFLNLIIQSENGILLDIDHTFWFDIFKFQMPDQSIRKEVHFHWYFAPVLLALVMMVTRRLPDKKRKNGDPDE